MNKFFTYCILILYSPNLLSQSADFTWQSTNTHYCSPATVRFTQTATGNPTGYVWTFGNNQGSNAANPSVTYTTSGTFTVRLIVIYKKSTVTVTKSIVINPAVTGSFAVNRDELCMPGTVQFHANMNEGITSYEWDFGGNVGATTTTSPVIDHYFPDYGTHTVSMKATAVTGCSGQSFSTVSVNRPTINATVSRVSGCVPAVIQFNATVGIPPATSVTSYTWQYGDAVTQTTTGATTTHTYPVAGDYIPKLHVVTNEGCSNDYTFNTISFGTPPANTVAHASVITFCGSESPSFVAKAVKANKYFWDFDNGDTTSVMDTLIRHRFKSLGTKTVTVTPLYNDCPGTPVSFTVNVIGVIAGFNYSNTCQAKNHFDFTNITQGNQSTINWSFGDGTSGLTTANVNHTFPVTGTYPTRLAVTDSITGCIDTASVNIYTAIPSLHNPDSSICKNSNTNFSIPNNYENPQASYEWNVTGLHAGPDDSSGITINANILGYFNNNFVIINNGTQYCPDTIMLNHKMLVRGPMLDFNAPAEICLSKPYISSNLSHPFVPADNINQWYWEYGLPGQADSVFQPQPYYYPSWGMPFQVKLTAVDINGCMDTLVKPVNVYDIPFLRSIPDVDTLCAGQSATLIAFHNDDITWTPSASISCATCDTVVVHPSTTTTYYVKATSRFNCSVTDSILIQVYTPFNAFVKKRDNYICSGEMLQFEVEPKNKIIRWSPASGLSDSTVYNPVALPSHSTTYMVSLGDSVGCFSSHAEVNVVVKQLPQVNAGPDKIFSYNSDFQMTPVYSDNVRVYSWQPATGLDCAHCPNPQGVAEKVQQYSITVISDSGCVAKDEITIFVECKYANLLFPTAFTPNRDQLNDYYYPITRGIKRIVRFAIYSREGRLVFEARDMTLNNPASGWNGTYKGAPQNSSTYVYLLEAICETGETINKKGSFVLLR